jgi:hypothetical protein
MFSEFMGTKAGGIQLIDEWMIEKVYKKYKEMILDAI